MTEIPSPFQHYTKDQLLRTSVNIPLPVINEIKRLEGKTGVIQNTVDVLLSKFYEQLKSANFLTSDRQSYHRAVNECGVIIGGQPKPADKTNNRKRSPAAKPATGKVVTIAQQTVDRDV